MDPSWCPACDRLILPKRLTVPVEQSPPTPLPVESEPPLSSSDSEHHPPPPPAPTPVLSSPEVRRKPLEQQQPTRTQRRFGGGLVHGTGRVRLGGGLKSSQERKRQPQQQQQQQQQQPHLLVVPPPTPTLVVLPPPPAKKRTRVIICQETPLYCSDECRQRDLKNSFIESENAGFAGAQAAFNRLTQLELVQETVRRLKSHRRSYSPTHSDTSTSPSTSPETPSNSEMCLLPTPPVPPNSLTDAPSPKLKGIFSTGSMSSESTSYTTDSLRGTTAVAAVVAGAPVSPPTASAPASAPAAPTVRPKRRPAPPRVPSWGSPTKAPLAPPAKTVFNVSSSSVDSPLLSIFDREPAWVDADEASSTNATTLSGSGSDGANASGAVAPALAAAGTTTTGKKKKRVSFASDSKPASIVASVPPVAHPPQQQQPHHHHHHHSHHAHAHHHHLPRPQSDWRLDYPRQRNPLLDANPLRAAVSVSPNRAGGSCKPSSLPSTQPAPPLTTRTKSTPDLTASMRLRFAASGSGPDLSAQTATPPLNPYRVAMWPEDEKRSSPCTRVHGELLRRYAKKFTPREGRTLMYSRLWEGIEPEELAEQVAVAAGAAGCCPSNGVTPTLLTKTSFGCRLMKMSEEEVRKALERIHESQPDEARGYWRRYEEKLAEERAKRKAEEEVRRKEEERVISEMLGGLGMREEDQPQARRMGKMAYDGMPGPAERRGLKYEFSHFLYDLALPKPQLVERTVRRWDPERAAFVEEVHTDQVYPERKKLFNFEE